MKIVRNLFQKLCVLVLLLLSNCQSDTVTETQQEETLQKRPSFKTTIISKQDIEANAKLSNKMNSLAAIQNDQIGKSVYNGTYDFSIDTYVAKLVESNDNDKHSYTFPISRENYTGSEVENLVLSYIETDDDYKASLITYHFSAEQKQQYLLIGYVDTPYEIGHEFIELDASSVLNKNIQPCIVTYQEFHNPQGSNNTYLHSSNGVVQNNCEHENDDDPCNVTYEIVIYCPDGGSSGTGDTTDYDTPPANNQNNSTSGGGAGSNETDETTDDEADNIITSPITREESTKQAIKDCINGLADFNTVDATTIDSEILNQNDLTLSEWIALNNYLQENNCSEDAQEEVIEALLDEYDDYKIINELEGKALCVYNKLKKLKGGFKESIKKFDGEFPVAHLKFESAPLDGTTKGSTIPPLNGTAGDVNSPDYQILIQINNKNNIYGHPQRPNLLLAKTIIHEVIHAEIFRKLLSLAKQGHLDFTGMSAEEQTNYMLSIRDNFPGIYDYMRRLNNWQHQQMATHYREAIARLLQEFDTGVAVPNSQQPQQLYMDLSWEGLIYKDDPDAVIAWVNLPQAERDRIELVISNYITNNINETCTE